MLIIFLFFINQFDKMANNFFMIHGTNQSLPPLAGKVTQPISSPLEGKVTQSTPSHLAGKVALLIPSPLAGEGKDGGALRFDK
jgi:hypothetical protein